MQVSKILTLLLLLVVGIGLTPRLQAMDVVVRNDFGHQSLGNGLEYLVAHEFGFEIDDAIGREDWLTSNEDVLSFTTGSSTHWVRFELSNRSQISQALILQVGFPLLEQAALFLVASDGAVERVQPTGVSIPRTQRALAHSELLLPFSIDANVSVSAYLKVTGMSNMRLPLKLWKQSEYIEHSHNSSLAYGLFFGLLFAIATYHLLIYISAREKSFIYYAMFCFSLLAIYTSTEGLVGNYIFSGKPSRTMIFLQSAQYLSIFSSCLYTYHVLAMAESGRKAGNLLPILAKVSLFVAFLSLFLDSATSFAIVVAMSFLSLALNFYIYFVRFLDGYPPAKYLMIGSAIASVGMTTSLLNAINVLPSTAATQNASYISVALMAMTYSFALAYRINMDKALREAAQADLIATQQQLTEELNERVRQRTKELERANEKLTVLSLTDGLTGLLNRRAFDQALEREVRRCRREAQWLSVLIIDIDHFKSINDNHGHDAGDQCLVSISECLRNSIHRPQDITARYGGEEFVVMLPDTDLNGAVHVAEKLRNAVKQRGCHYGDHEIKMTISIGVAATGGKDGEYENLMKEADKQLYRAKANGRDQVQATNEGEASDYLTRTV